MNKRKAMVALEKALEWQELFDIAYTVNLDKEEISSMAYRITGSDPFTKFGLSFMWMWFF